jgi:hypothetical protein
MPEFTDAELEMFGEAMPDSELTDLLLIDMEMSQQGELQLPVLSERQIREVRAATHAAIYTFGNEVEIAPNVVVGKFGQSK